MVHLWCISNAIVSNFFLFLLLRIKHKLLFLLYIDVILCKSLNGYEMVYSLTVNQLVVGSIPTAGASIFNGLWITIFLKDQACHLICHHLVITRS